MSDAELLRLLDSRADEIADALKKRRARHLACFEEIQALEEEIVPLQTMLGSVMAAARDIRSGGSRKNAGASSSEAATPTKGMES